MYRLLSLPVGRYELRAKKESQRSAQATAARPVQMASRFTMQTTTAQVCFRDPTGPGTGASSKHGNVFSHDFLAQFGEGRPTDREHGLRGHIAHQVRGFARKEDLDLVTSVGQGQPMREWEGGTSGIIGSPGALDHDVERFVSFGGLSIGRTQPEHTQAEQFGKVEISSRRNIVSSGRKFKAHVMFTAVACPLSLEPLAT